MPILETAARALVPRAQRYVPRASDPITVEVAGDDWQFQARLSDISQTGMACLVDSAERLPEPGMRASRVRLLSGDVVQAWAVAAVNRLDRLWAANEPTNEHLIALSFDSPQTALVNSLLDRLAPSPYITDDLLGNELNASREG